MSISEHATTPIYGREGFYLHTEDVQTGPAQTIFALLKLDTTSSIREIHTNNRC